MIDVRTLFVAETAAKILQVGLGIAQAMGLPVTTWRTGDTTRSLYKFVATVLASLEGVVSEYIRAGFLSTASGDWLTVLAWEVYGVPRNDATYADPTVSVVNTGGGNFTFEPGEASFKNSITGKTYHNTNTVTFSGVGATATFELEADEAGSDSSVGLNEIDEIITAMNGVTITGSTVGLANDEESDEALQDRCRASLGSLSPNGPADAFEYVATTPSYTGQTGVTRAKAVGSTTGAITVYVAGPSGGVDGAAVAAVQEAVERWCTPLCCDPTAVSASTFNVTLAMTIRKSTTLEMSDAEIETAIESAIVALFAATKIGGDGSGHFNTSPITNAVHEAVDGILYVEDVTVNSNVPEDESIGPTHVPVLAALALTIQ